MRFLAAIELLAALLTLGAAAAESVPLPRPRPAEAPPRPRSEPSACQQRLASDGHTVTEPLPPLVGPGECGARDVVRLDAILMPNATRVALVPQPTLRCSMAEALADWVRTDIGPLAGRLGSPLAEIENYDSYDCRAMNGIAGAKLSEHGRANALDIRSVKLADGRVFRITAPTVAHDFREHIKASACARFMTVLGPGSDGYHEEHIHVDLAERRNKYRICQWEVRDPPPIPVPRPRPAIAQNGSKEPPKYAAKP